MLVASAVGFIGATRAKGYECAKCHYKTNNN